MKRTILCYGDSNTFGQCPGNPEGRYDYDHRWPNIMQKMLGESWHVIEEGLSGRTTVSDDPIEGACRNGRTYLKPCLDSHKPIDLIILMLGTNDLKFRFNKSASEVALGVAALIRDIKVLAVGIGGTTPEILVVSPPTVLEDLKTCAQLFAGAPRKSIDLPAALQAIADASGVHFFDSSTAVVSSSIDGFHLDEGGHQTLATAMAQEVLSIGWLS